MNQLTATWLNRVGLICDILAFTLASPEIFGEVWLRRLERLLERILRLLSEESNFSIALFAVLMILFYVTGLGNMEIPDFGILGFQWVLLILVVVLISRGMDFIAKRASAYLKRQVERLADDSQIRRRALAVGAGFFFIGAILQLIATF